MKKILPVLILVATFALAGCKTAPSANYQATNVAAIQLLAQTATAGVLLHSPQYLPAFQAAEAAMSSLALQTNAVPGGISSALYGLNVGGKLAPIITSTFAGIMNLVSQIEAGNTNTLTLQADALAVRNGIQSGIALATAPAP